MKDSSRGTCAPLLSWRSVKYFSIFFQHVVPDALGAARLVSAGNYASLFFAPSDATVSAGREEICKCNERAPVCCPAMPRRRRSPALSASRAPYERLFDFFRPCSSVIYVVFFFFFFSSLLALNLWRGQAAVGGVELVAESWRVAAPPTCGRGSLRDRRATATCRPPSGAAHTPAVRRRRRVGLPISHASALQPQAGIDTSACASFLTTTMCNLVTCHGREAARSFW